MKMKNSETDFETNSNTTGMPRFAVCPRHTAKHKKTLSKAFAECYTRQMALGVHSVGKDFFIECFLSCTRQRLVFAEY